MTKILAYLMRMIGVELLRIPTLGESDAWDDRIFAMGISLLCGGLNRTVKGVK